jgi:hypothetical protein
MQEISISDIDFDKETQEWLYTVTDEIYSLMLEEPEIRKNSEVENTAINWTIETIKSSINKLLDWEYWLTKYQFREQRQNTLKHLKNVWFLNNNSHEWKLLWKLLKWHTTKKWNIIEWVLSVEDIAATIKSYYRKKALQSFEKITQLVGIKSKLRNSYNTDDIAKSIFKEIQQDMSYINWEDLDNEYLVSQKELSDFYKSVFLSLDAEDIKHLAIAYREIAISFNFNTSIDQIKMTFDNILILLNSTSHDNRETLKTAIKKQLNELES